MHGNEVLFSYEIKGTKIHFEKNGPVSGISCTKIILAVQIILSLYMY